MFNGWARGGGAAAGPAQAEGAAAAGELLAAYRAARDPADVYHEEAAAAAAAYGPDEPAWRRHYAAQRAAQAVLLRCLVGPLPFRPAALDPEIGRCSTGCTSRRFGNCGAWRRARWTSPCGSPTRW